MNIKICRLDSSMIEDYLYFFENVAHKDNAEEDRCYCVCWCSADHRNNELSNPAVRRKKAIEYINNGVLDGYVAYQDDKIVGWCNANTKSDCVYCYSWLKFMQEVELLGNEKVKSIFCFAIAPDMRRKGIARMLLDRVCEDAVNEGFDYVEAYPREKQLFGELNIFGSFQGPYNMFEQAGFVEYKKLSDKVIVRKYMK